MGVHQNIWMLPSELLPEVERLWVDSNSNDLDTRMVNHLCRVLLFDEDSPVDFHINAQKLEIDGDKMEDSFDLITAIKDRASLALSRRAFPRMWKRGGIYYTFLRNPVWLRHSDIHSTVQAATNSYVNNFEGINTITRRYNFPHTICKVGEVWKLVFHPNWEKLLLESEPVSLWTKLFWASTNQKIFDFLLQTEYLGRNVSKNIIRTELGFKDCNANDKMRALMRQLPKVNNRYYLENPWTGLYRLIDSYDENIHRVNATKNINRISWDFLSIPYDLLLNSFNDMEFDIRNFTLSGIKMDMDEFILCFLIRDWEGDLTTWKLRPYMIEEVLWNDEITRIINQINLKLSSVWSDLRISSVRSKFKFIRIENAELDLWVPRWVSLPKLPF